jgi:DNA-binding XRE family transcriptional regulator
MPRDGSTIVMAMLSLENRKNRLKVLRAERDLTQEALAAAVGLDADRYWRIEREKIAPTPDERRRIIAHLNEVGKPRGLARVTIASSGLDADPDSDKPGRPRARGEPGRRSRSSGAGVARGNESPTAGL